MSERTILVCDGCGGKQKRGTGEFHTPYDPDFYDCWWRLRRTVFDTPEVYDFCCSECLVGWAQKQLEKDVGFLAQRDE